MLLALTPTSTPSRIWFVVVPSANSAAMAVPDYPRATIEAIRATLKLGNGSANGPPKVPAL